MTANFSKNKNKLIIYLTVMFFLLNSTVVYGQVLNESSASGMSEEMFSQEEQLYIQKKQELRVAILDQWSPIACRAEEGEGYRGLSVDLLSRLEQNSGLKITYIEAASYLDAIKMAENGSVDIAAVVEGFHYAQDPHDIQVTKPYLESQMLLLHNRTMDFQSMSGYRLAEVKGYSEFSDNPVLEHMYFDTQESALLAIRANHADLMYCDLFTGMTYMHQYENRDLVFFPINIEIQYSFGISNSQGPELKSIVEKTIDGFNRKAVNESLLENHLHHVDSLGDFVYRYPFEIICIIFAVSFLVVLFFITYTRIKNHEATALHGYIKSYNMLADAFGEAGLNYEYIKDKMTVFGTNADRLSMPLEIERFSEYLESEEKDISLTKQQFEQLLQEGMKGSSYQMELTCRLKSGEWQHFRILFSVITTDEAYRRPIGMIGCLINIEEDYREREQLLQMGLYDPLTQLYNRAGAELEITKRTEDGESMKRDLLLVMDVDLFKRINDTYGHSCGDDVLMNVGLHLKQIFRREDILCRWGGDEFLLYLTGAAEHIDRVKYRCASLQKTMKGYSRNGKSIPITLSIGGSVVGEQSFQDAFETADQQLYMVKQNGRDALRIAADKRNAAEEMERNEGEVRK